MECNSSQGNSRGTNDTIVLIGIISTLGLVQVRIEEGRPTSSSLASQSAIYVVYNLSPGLLVENSLWHSCIIESEILRGHCATTRISRSGMETMRAGTNSS